MKEVAIPSFLGAIGLCIASAVYHWLFFRPVLYDGQYGMAAVGNFIVGLVLGAISGYMVTYARTYPRTAVTVGAAGISVVSMLLLIYLWLVTSNDNGRSGETLFATLLSHLMFCLPVVLWIFAIVVWIARILRQN